MILVELALKNVRTQLKSYLIYFFSMAFSVMVYYSFISMSLDKYLVERIGTEQRIDSTLKAASMMIVLFILVFMFSANGFFLKKRKKEIGLYNLLGMRKFSIGLLFFMENLAIGIGALLTGIVSGVVFSKLFAMLLVKAMYVEADSNFAFSLQAVQHTVMMFMIMLIFVSFRSGRVVYRYKLVDLFRANQKGTRLKKISLVTLGTGILGVFLIGYGYYQAVHLADYMSYLNEQMRSDMGLFYAVMFILLFCVSGTYLFFHGFLQIMISVIQKIKSFYYRDIHMVTTGSLRFNLKRNATTLGTIAVLSGTALAAIGGATNVYSFGLELVDNEIPLDYLVDSRDYPSLEAIIDEFPDHSVTDKVELTIKQVGGHFVQHIYEFETVHTIPIAVVSLSNYHELSKVNQLLKPITLEEDNEVVLLQRVLGSSMEKDFSTFSDVILQSYSQPLKIKEYRPDGLGGAYNERYSGNTIVVSEKLYETLSSEHRYQLTMVNVKNGRDSADLSRAVEERFPQKVYYEPVNLTVENGQVVGEIGAERVVVKKADAADQERSGYLRRENINARYPELVRNRMSYGQLVYTAIFLGVVFLIATGSIIMLKQLSEAQEEKARYQMLRKMGVPQKMIRRSVYSQNFLVFFLPLTIAYLHSKYALVSLSFIVSSRNDTLTWLARVFLAIIFIAFYFVTATSYNRIVND